MAPRYQPLSDEMVQIIMKKHEKGIPVAEIAEALELTKQRVTNTIKRETTNLDEGVKEVIVKLAYQDPGAPLSYIAEAAQEMCDGECPDLKLTAAIVNKVLKETGWKGELQRRAKNPPGGDYMASMEDEEDED